MGLKSRIPQYVRDVDARRTVAVAETANEVRDGARDRIAVRSGEARDSIETESMGPAKARVVVRAFYGQFLEHGTVKMAPRPFLLPAAEAARSSFKARIRRAVR